MSRMAGAGPLAGVRVVEVALGVSAVGAGLAVSLPGSLLRDLGAEVARVESAVPGTLDAGLELGRAWNRGKDVATVDEAGAPQQAAAAITALAAEADVVILGGAEDRLERRGIGYRALSRVNPRLITVRIRPSVTEGGPVPDLELLVAARTGLLSQIRAHRQHPGDTTSPAVNDLAVASAGAGLSAAVGALALLYRREGTGAGGWAETSLYDGIAALLPMITGSVERHSPTTTLLWKNQGPAEALSYRCGDGEYVQLWFGAKGAFEDFLEHIGDPPSVAGYNAELMSDAMEIRGQRWARMFAREDRDWWLADLAGHKFRCEPVWHPGQALRDPHVRGAGLAVDEGDCTFLGPVLRVAPAGQGTSDPDNSNKRQAAGALLEGVRVLDLSAYLAGPVTPLILGELGADVVKVEPPSGDAHRRMAPMYAAGQRGKRAVALDLKGPDAAGLLPPMFRWADVVHHNSRVGLAERLGYDEAAVRAANPAVVYSFASGFGESGPRALLPANDQLMQALAGIEAGQGGAGQPPTYLVWGAVDTASGWITATGVLAGLYARRRTGAGQSVSASLLGAALTLKSGAFLQDGATRGGPLLDADQAGYGAAYRIYQGADGGWLALAIPDQRAWDGLRAVAGLPRLPPSPPALRTGRPAVSPLASAATPAGRSGPAEGESPARSAPAGSRDWRAQPAEVLLERAFRGRPAAWWVAALQAAGVPAELVRELDRAGFAAAFTADPVAVQRGRVVSYQWGDHGLTRQPVLAPAIGPVPRPATMAGIAGLGEHTNSFGKEI
jgi:crotonobetainyl-CoA:carnitine CoA-transferase CaiB-like acyl-CoA transferase